MNERVVVPEPPRPLAPSPPISRAANAARSPRKYPLIVGLLAILLAIGIAGVWWVLGANGTVQYTTAPVTRGAVTRTVTATGTVNPELTIIVGSYVSGVIQELYCDYNTQVKKGQVCAKIDPRPYQTRGRSGQGQPRGRQGAARKGQGEPRLRQGHLRAHGQAGPDQCRSPRTPSTTPRASTSRRRRRSRSTRQRSSSGRRCSTPRRSISTTPTSFRRWTARWCRATSRMGQTVAASFQTPTLFLIATDLTKMQVDTNVSESDIGGIKAGQQGHFHGRRLSRARRSRAP